MQSISVCRGEPVAVQALNGIRGERVGRGRRAAGRQPGQVPSPRTQKRSPRCCARLRIKRQMSGVTQEAHRLRLRNRGLAVARASRSGERPRGRPFSGLKSALPARASALYAVNCPRNQPARHRVPSATDREARRSRRPWQRTGYGQEFRHDPESLASCGGWPIRASRVERPQKIARVRPASARMVRGDGIYANVLALACRCIP